ncbi:MAG: TIGR01212 family radical SAM protein [Treponema sp.]|nr:TIGR01212 family radical SAM protein [Treponema sp.]
MYVSDFYKNIFGCKVYKISLDAGCTCPNRDGTKGKGGCIFCSAKGSGDFSSSGNKTISEQIVDAKKLVGKKNKGGKYIAYFQSFSNTYGDAEYLAKLYNEAADSPDIVGISIATRPDCLSDEILLKIKSLCSRTFVQLELGLQTVNENTAKYIRRHYTNEDYENAVNVIRKTDSRIHIVTHVIFGLPGDTETDMLQTVRKTVMSGSDGIKISVLHVLKDTDLYKDYLDGKFKTLEEDEYYNLLSKALGIIPSHTVIHRLTGDGPKSILVSPLWTANKRHVHNEISRRFNIW